MTPEYYRKNKKAVRAYQKTYWEKNKDSINRIRRMKRKKTA